MINADNISEILNDYLSEHNFDCYAELGTDFAYWDGESKITYALVTPTQQDEWFKEYAESVGLEYDCGNFVLSFFHELGHEETNYIIDEDEEQEIMEEKDRMCADCGFSDREKAMYYFQLPDEKLATQWAVEYINSNYDDIKELVDKLAPAVVDFYRDNGIEEFED